MTLLYILTYFSAAVFVIAVALRFIKFATTPAHLRWELYPVAHEGKRSAYGGSYLEDGEWWNKKSEQNKLGELTVMLPEIFLLLGIWEHNRKMWLWSFLMHHGVYWLAGLAGFMLLGGFLGLVGAGDGGFANFIPKLFPIFGMVGYIAGTIGTLGMLVIRTTDSGLKKYSAFSTYFNLLFLLAIFVTGLVNLFTNSDMFVEMAGFFAGLVGAGFVEVSGMTALHLTWAILFVLYLPFTHMTHFFTKYFTYHSVRWNDEPNIRGGKLEKQIIENLQFKPTWSAKHIGADGNKNWAEIATSEMPEDEK